MKTPHILAILMLVPSALSHALALTPYEVASLGASAKDRWPIEFKESLRRLTPDLIVALGDDELIGHTHSAFSGAVSDHVSELFQNTKLSLFYIESQNERFLARGEHLDRVASNLVEVPVLKKKLESLRGQLQDSLRLVSGVLRTLHDGDGGSHSYQVLSTLWQQKLETERHLMRTINTSGVGGPSPSGRAGAARWNVFGNEVPLDNDPEVIELNHKIKNLNGLIAQTILTVPRKSL